MSKLLAGRVKKVKPSPTLAVTQKVREMKARGIKVIDFGVGEPDFDTPQAIKDSAIKAINDGFTKYTASSGIPELKEAIINKFKKDNNLTYRPEQVIVSCGAKHSLYNIAQALFEEGDEVIIPAPYWVSYPSQVILNGALPVILKTREADDFQIDPERLRSVISPKTKAIILNSPSNPTGLMYNRRTLEEIGKIALENDIYIISDEIYEKIIYDGREHISIASFSDEIKELCIVVNGVSKAYAMTGWRIGYTAGPVDLIKAMDTVQSQSTSNPSSISQKAAIAALRGGDVSIKAMLSEFDMRRARMVKMLRDIQGVKCLTPEGAFYTFPNVSSFFGREFKGKTMKNSIDIATLILTEAKVAVVAGESFGEGEHIRMSYSTSMENIEAGLKNIKGLLESLS